MFSALGSDRFKIEASFWAGVLVIVWHITPLQTYLDEQMAAFVDWISLGLASVAVLTAIQVKRRLRQKIERGSELKSLNPLGLIDCLREHAVREFGSMYLYMPIPKQAKHKDAWAWVETLQDKGLIKGNPWHIKASHIKETVKEGHPGLFKGAPTQFDIYKLDWQTLSKTMGDDLD